MEVNVAGHVECRGREWEVGTALTGIEWPGKKVSYWPIFRDVNRPQDFFFLAEFLGERVLPRIKNTEGILTLSGWSQHLELAFERGAWGWASWFEEEICRGAFWSDKELQTGSSPECAEWCLFLLPSRYGAWSEDFSYPFRCEADAPSGEHVSTQDWVRGALLRATDCRMALKFARLSGKLKVAFALIWRWGSLAEFERICRLIGQVAIDWDDDWEGEKLDVTVGLNGFGKAYARSDAPKFWNIPNLNTAQPLWELARKASGIEVKPTLRTRESIVHWFEEGTPSVSVTIEPPNAHEKTEALMNLRALAQEMGIEEELGRALEGNGG